MSFKCLVKLEGTSPIRKINYLVSFQSFRPIDEVYYRGAALLKIVCSINKIFQVEIIIQYFEANCALVKISFVSFILLNVFYIFSVSLLFSINKVRICLLQNTKTKYFP